MCGPSQKEYNPYKISAAYFGIVSKSDIQEFYFPNLGPIKDSTYINGVGGVQYILPYKTSTGDILLIIYYYKVYPLPGKAFYSLYNFTNKQILYDNKSMSTYLTGPPVIYNNRIYNATSQDISCIDLLTGQLIWVNKQYGGFSSEGFTIGDGKLIALCEGTYPKSVIAYDLETGSLAWKTDSYGTISPMRYLNGVVYFASSGDGRLHAIDASNGNYLWRLKSPDLKINSGGFFKPECNVIPGKNGEKGKVIVSSYFSGICYEAEK
jgi:outer membrane protein assembly factor BamB